MKDARLTYLERRHKVIQNEIAEAEAQTTHDDLMLADLKRRKLHLETELDWAQQEAHKLKIFHIS